MSIANEILKQLGGNKFIAMTGAKNLGAGENYLVFKIGKNAGNINYIKITLNSLDTYDVTYSKVWGMKITTKAESKGLYNDMLQADFTAKTGMYTSL